MPDITILHGNALDRLGELAAGSIQCVVTSPPYWGPRDYGVPGTFWPAVEYRPMPGLEPIRCPEWFGCLGLEPDPVLYVGHLVAVFREVWRCLRDDGTLWLNLGDSYTSGNRDTHGTKVGYKQQTNRGMDGQNDPARLPQPAGLKPKDLLGIPWRVAFALQADGWYLRSDVIWAKPNVMPESVRDRPTKAHELIFLLAKDKRYFYDQDAIREGFKTDPCENYPARAKALGRGGQAAAGARAPGSGPDRDHSGGFPPRADGRNRRSVWTVPTRGFKGAHYATFPPDLIEPCLKAGTSARGRCPACGAAWNRIVERGKPKPRPDNPNPVLPYDAASNHTHGTGKTTLHKTVERVTTGWDPSCSCGYEPVPCVVADPFFGAGTVGLVAAGLGLDCIGLELSGEYAVMGRDRIMGEIPLLARVRIVPFGSEWAPSGA